MTDLLLPLGAVLVTALDLAFLAMVTTALLARLGHGRLQRWMFR